MERVHDEDQLGKLLGAASGFIYNDFAPGARPDSPPSKSASGNVLHAADCGHLQVSLSVAKYHSEELEDAVEWLVANRGEEGPAWHRCPCLAAESSGKRTAAPKAGSTQTPGQPVEPGTPFREAEVERLLYRQLESEGYRVERKVSVESGIIDAVATRGDERVVIEAKGEDSGGYGTTQMNFQIGLGQLASRMVDEDSEYALAFPDTPDFRRVLRTFRGSLAFRRLNFRFYLVGGEDGVRMIDAAEISEWVEGL